MPVHTIAAQLPFLDRLVDGLLGQGPDVLADTLLLLPSRRACMAARDAFLRRSEGRPLLLPRLQPIGEPDELALLLDPAAALALPPVIGELERRLVLTRLVLARDREMTHEQAVRLAGELESFLDELATEEIDLAALDGLVDGELAEHWQRVLQFLGILRHAWPAVLAERSLIEPAERRRLLLDAAATRWTAAPPRGPVIAAGVSGSIPAVARLLRVVAGLPEGHVVLPGLDLELNEQAWSRLGPSHPQAVLKHLLERIGIDRAAVRLWMPAAEGRRALWREVMRPSTALASAPPLGPFPGTALAGLTLVEAPDQAGESLAIALRMRAVLEEPGRTAMLVSPDRQLARRVAADLGRFGVRVDDSAGIPLDQSPPGSFLLLTAHLLAPDAAPAAILAALKHPLARGGTADGSFRRHVRALERATLRGPRPGHGLAGVQAILRGPAEEGARWPSPIPCPELEVWLDGILQAAARFTALLRASEASLAELLRAHLVFAEWLARDAEGDPAELWAKEAGIAAQAFVAELQGCAQAIGAIPTTAYAAMLAVLMGDRQVRPRAQGHPRLAILGQIESRLASADLVLVGGLVEGVWPPTVESGPWLNRTMRRKLGLPAPEQRIGLAALDLVQVASGAEVVLSRSAKDGGGSPAIPSRWLSRLEALLEATGQRGAIRPDPTMEALARQLDEPLGPPRPTPRPRPTPPLAMRPRRLAATDIERLLRNPYAIYAKRILGLDELDPIDADPGQAERGLIVHRALESFVRAYPAELPDRPLEELLRIGQALFQDSAHRPQVMTVWWPRFVGVAGWFIEQERRRRQGIAHIRTELDGRLVVSGLPGGEVTIRARADRIEIGHDGRLGIVDYKTGSVPTEKDVVLGRSPQLTIEALVAAGGGFTGLAAGDPALLLYVQLKGGEVPGSLEQRGKAGVGELLAAARQGLQALLGHFDNPATPYIAIPRPEIARYRDAIDHLARVAEWRGVE